MRKIYILFVLILNVFLNQLYAQQKFIEITKKDYFRAVKIKEDRRVVVQTLDNKIVKGKLKIIDSSQIEVDSTVISLASISCIKKRSVSGVVFRSLAMFSGTSLTIMGIVAIPTGIGALVSVVVLPPSFPLLMYAINSNKRRSDKWDYKIVTN